MCVLGEGVAPAKLFSAKCLTTKGARSLPGASWLAARPPSQGFLCFPKVAASPTAAKRRPIPFCWSPSESRSPSARVPSRDHADPLPSRSTGRGAEAGSGNPGAFAAPTGILLRGVTRTRKRLRTFGEGRAGVRWTSQPQPPALKEGAIRP